jgi:sarcosine reductase
VRLELGNIEVKDIVFGDELKLDGGTLTVNKQELIDLVLEDDA